MVSQYVNIFITLIIGILKNLILNAVTLTTVNWGVAVAAVSGDD